MTTLLATLLDYETTLAQVARLAVPMLADWCSVHVAEEDGSIRWLAAAHGDPEKEALARELGQRFPYDPAGPEGMPTVLRTGRPLRYAAVSDAQRTARARDATHLQLLRALALQAAMIVPLQARGRTIGALSLVSTQPGRTYRPADLRLAEELAERAALAVDNARLYRQLQQAVEARDTSVAAITHDLKGPLATIRMMAYLLEPVVAQCDPVDAKAVEWIERIGALTMRMAGQIDGVLDLAQVQAGHALHLHRQTVDLIPLVLEEAAAHEELSQRHSIEVTVMASRLVGTWDEQRLQRVVGNVLGNAIKHSPDGDLVRVRLSRTPAKPEDAAKAWTVLTVEDHGVGIPAADLPHIFTRFHRGTNVTGRIKGSGVGLTTVKRVVEQHRGTLTVASMESCGTTITIRLPLDDLGD